MSSGSNRLLCKNKIVCLFIVKEVETGFANITGLVSGERESPPSPSPPFTLPLKRQWQTCDKLKGSPDWAVSYKALGLGEIKREFSMRQLQKGELDQTLTRSSLFRLSLNDTDVTLAEDLKGIYYRYKQHLEPLSEP